MKPLNIAIIVLALFLIWQFMKPKTTTNGSNTGTPYTAPPRSASVGLLSRMSASVIDSGTGNGSRMSWPSPTLTAGTHLSMPAMVFEDSAVPSGYNSLPLITGIHPAPRQIFG